jgi:hypothetical protein
VLVGGEPVVSDGLLLADDLADVLRRHDKAARRIQGC